MPWRGPAEDGEYPTLGPQIAAWVETNFRVPDGPLAGDPLVLTDEQFDLLCRFYGLDDRGRFLFRRAAVRRSKGWGKSPLLGAIALAEVAGPTVFDGWDSAGEPVGVVRSAPWVQVAAASEDQTDNTYDALYQMAANSSLPYLDVGLTRIHRTDGPGKLEPVTSSSDSREGQRVTFAVLDETHLWLKRNGGHKLAKAIIRNASKMDGRTFETTNAHLPGEDSVAERTFKAWEAKSPGLLYDSVEAPWVEDLTDKVAVREALRVAYGDAAWINLDRLVDECGDPGTDPEDIRRFYFNQLVSSANQFLPMPEWDALAAPDGLPPDGAYIGLGFDGSISGDSTVLYGCTPDGYVFEVAGWHRPAGVDEWRVSRSEVHSAVADAFARWNVGLMLCDPPRWQTELEGWVELYGEDVVVAFDTNQSKRMSAACDRFATGVRERRVSHDGGRVLTDHLAACSRKKVRVNDDEGDGRTRFVIVKTDTRKIDAAVAAVLALEAAETMPAEPVEATWFGGWA